jgi:hypothetical protein
MHRTWHAVPRARADWVVALALAAMLAGGVLPGQALAQGEVVVLGILQFQDESGAGLPTLGQSVAQLVRQKLSSQHGDTVPRVLKVPGADVTAGPATLEQLQALGRQYTARFVIQGGILPIETAAAGDRTTVTVSLYADVVVIDSGQTRTLRVDSSVTHPGTGLGIADPASVDPASPAFAQTPVGQALNDAAGRLADSIYLAIAPAAAGAPPVAPAAAAAAVQPAAPAEPTAAPPPAAPPPSPQEVDLEVQQLIADTQNAIATYGGASPQLAEQARSGLEQLQNALAQKADQMSKGQDTQATDQAISQIMESLRATLASLMQAQVGAPGQAAAPSQSVLARVDAYAGESLSLLQKIQELRAVLGSAYGGAAAGVSPTDAGAAPSPGQPVVETPGEVSGVVVQDGQPVAGAEVTETSTGVSATTGPDGSYVLRGLPPGLLANLAIRRKGQVVATGRVQVVAMRPNLADFQLRQGGVTSSRLGALGSTATPAVAGRNAGTLRGQVTDAQRKPVALALVTVPGVGAVRTNARGEYLFTGVPPGAHPVTVRSSQGTTTAQASVGAGAIPTVSNVQLAAVTPVPGGATIAPKLAVVGRAGAQLQGRVRDQSNKDLPGVRVTLLREAGALSVLTDAAGRFELRDLSPGRYRVVVARPGFETATRDLDLKANDREKIDLKLKQTSALVDQVRRVEASKQATLRGIVRGPDRKGLANADVRATLGGAFGGVFGARTNRDGEYSLAVREGQLTVVVSCADFIDASRVVTVSGGQKATQDFNLQRRLVTATPPIVRAPAAGEATKAPPAEARPVTTPPRVAPSIVLPQSLARGQVQGQVVDGRTGKPVAGASVTLSGGGSVVTDSRGNYRMDNVAAGSYDITVSRPGYLGQTRKMRIEAGKTATADFKLSASIQLRR